MGRFFHKDLYEKEGIFYNDVDSNPIVYKKGKNVNC